MAQRSARSAHGGFLLTVLDITLDATVESLLGIDSDRRPVTLRPSCSMLAPHAAVRCCSARTPSTAPRRP
ncbi:hypothetical protein [Cryptosporangium arvum]|uniref:hypothetical protein n=1 Tax=Cryptosporangium arvum TaxID=80871 RepID=UPI0004B1189E|nr:hypothetical protein [Cryptosporangium arvum]